MNPATFLRVIGPEAWRVCYVEPSVRPDDSRYGENPNRLQQHTQLQVLGPKRGFLMSCLECPPVFGVRRPPCSAGCAETRSWQPARAVSWQPCSPGN